MHISLEWLSDFIDLPSMNDLHTHFDKAGIEIESISDPRSINSGIVVGKITDIQKHSKSKKLNICSITDGKNTFQVICGANNVELQKHIAFARIGAKLGDINITSRIIMGIKSEGMICSKSELGLEKNSSGIWILPETSKLGDDIFKSLRILPVLNLSITPNRPDLLSHIGIAREISAFSGIPLKYPSIKSTKNTDISSNLQIKIENKESCKRYIAKIVRSIRVSKSPLWLQNRLERIGQRCVNNVVDISNYLMFEWGHPTHIFDLSRVVFDPKNPSLFIRNAYKKEKIITLDGIDRELYESDIVIANKEKALALAGIIGGKTSEIQNSTTDVLIESAYFNPQTIRLSARKHKIQTESSYRFERGTNISILPLITERCANLLVEIANAQDCEEILDMGDKKDDPIEITLNTPQIKRVLGIEISSDKAVELLKPLQIDCKDKNLSQITFKIPKFRVDISREIDIIEELARIYGYSNIPESLPEHTFLYSEEPQKECITDIFRNILVHSGYNEITTFGFGSPKQAVFFDKSEPLRILNPLGEELSSMRTSLLPNILKVVEHNQRHSQKNIQIFEIGTIFNKKNPNTEEKGYDALLAYEKRHLTLATYGIRDEGRWYSNNESIDFSDIKGMVDKLLEFIRPQGILSFIPTKDISFLNPLSTALIKIDHIEIGFIGQIHPKIAKEFSLENPIFIAQISLDICEKIHLNPIQYTSLPKYPKIRRDIALIVDRFIPSIEIKKFIETQGSFALEDDVIEKVYLFDIYEGDSIPSTKISLAFAIEYRSQKRTLTDIEVGKSFNILTEKLLKEFSAQIR